MAMPKNQYCPHDFLSGLGGPGLIPRAGAERRREISRHSNSGAYAMTAWANCRGFNLAN